MSAPTSSPSPAQDPIELAIRDLVPQPADSIFVSAIAERIVEEAETTPWLMPELTAFFPELDGLGDYLDSSRHQQRAVLPQKGEPGYPVIRCLAADRTAEKLESPLTALVLAVLARAAHSRRLSQSPKDSYAVLAEAAEEAAGSLSRSRIGITRSDVNARRIAFLRVARPAADSLDYAKTLQKYLASPERLPRGRERDDAKPDKTLEVLLRSTVIPILSGTLHLRARPSADEEQPEDWEFDDLPDQTEYIPLPGSAEDEQVDDEMPIRTDPVTIKEMSDLLDEAFDDPVSLSIAQSIHNSNDHLSDLHADVLTPAEAQALTPALLLNLEQSIQDRDVVRAGHLAILSLMLATGLTRERVARALHPAGRVGNPARYFTSDCNFLISPVLGPRRRRGSDLDSDSSEEPFRKDQKLAIPIPPALAEKLREVRNLSPIMVPPGQGNVTLERTLRSVANQVGFPSITIGRLRRYPSARIFQDSQDLPAVMVLCGDTFGRSLAPLHYVAWTAADLQKLYQSAIWPLWKPPTAPGSQAQAVAPAPPPNLPRIVGSPHAAEAELARRTCPMVGAGVYTGIPDPATATRDQIITLHNLMAAHFTALLMGVVGHRPCNSVFRLTCMDFDPELQLALFRDKSFDAAHITRLVALGKRVSKQYRQYLSHLLALAGCKLPAETAWYIHAAIKGKRPLLFGLNESGRPKRWDLAEWRRHLPDAWCELRSNYGRHVLATRGRRHRIDPEWIAIQMGHFDLVGYPYTPDSPTYPTSLAKIVGPLLDEVFRAHGWRNLRGLAPKRTTHSPLEWESTGPLKLWARDIKAHEARCKHSKEQLRRHFLTATAQQRHEAESVLVEILEHQHRELAALLAEQFNKIRSKRQETLLPPSDSFTITGLPPKVQLMQDDWDVLLNELEETLSKRPSLLVAARNRLVVGLRGLSKGRIYKGPVPAGYRYRALPDPSPFPRQIFHAHLQIQALRRYFRTLTSPKTKNQSSQDLWELGKTTLALVIYGQITDIRILTALLHAQDNVIDRIPASPGSLMVHTAKPVYSVALHRVSALSYGKWHTRPHHTLSSDSDKALSQINCALSLVLPHGSVPESKPLEALLSTMEVVCRLEQSGFQRHCLAFDSGSVPLPPERCREYLQTAEITPKPGSTRPSGSVRRTVTISELTRQLKELKELIPEDARQIFLPRTSHVIDPKTQRYKPAHDALAEELSLWIDDTTLAPIIRQTASWLRYTILRPKHRGSGGRLEWKSVAGYFGAVRKALCETMGWIDLNKETDTEDLEACYLRAIELETGDRGYMAVQLMDFHSHLESEYGYDAIDRSLFLPYLSPLRIKLGNVSADVLLPEEAEQIQSIMTWSIRTDQEPSSGQDIRLRQQSVMVQQLIHASGGRIAEVAGLQHRDVILHDEGLYLILRANGYRGVKTPASRRLVPLSFSHHPEFIEFSDWIKNERALLKIKSLGRQFIFASWGSRELIGKVVLGQLVRSAIHEVNGEVGPHHSRHYNVTEDLSLVQLGRSPRDRVTDDLCPFPHDLLPRDMAARAYNFGHRRARTSGRCYFHLPGVCSISSQAIHLGSEDVNAESVAWGISVDSYRRRRKRNKAPALLSSLDHLAKVPAKPQTSPVESQDLRWTFNRKVPTYCQALNAVCSGKAHSNVGRALGLSPAEMKKLLESARRIESDYGVRLLPDPGKKASYRPRWRGQSRQLMEIWSAVEVDQSTAHLDLVDRVSLAMRDKAKRKRLQYSPALRDQIESLAPQGMELSASRNPDLRLDLRVTTDGQLNDITREYIWVCCIALASLTAMGTLE